MQNNNWTLKNKYPPYSHKKIIIGVKNGFSSWLFKEMAKSFSTKNRSETVKSLAIVASLLCMIQNVKFLY